MTRSVCLSTFYNFLQRGKEPKESKHQARNTQRRTHAHTHQRTHRGRTTHKQGNSRTCSSKAKQRRATGNERSKAEKSKRTGAKQSNKKEIKDDERIKTRKDEQRQSKQRKTRKEKPPPPSLPRLPCPFSSPPTSLLTATNISTVCSSLALSSGQFGRVV